MIESCSQSVVDTSLKELNKKSENLWSIKEGKLYSEFKFPDFILALGFMVKVAIVA